MDRRRWCRRLNRVLDELYRKASLPASAETFVKIPPHDPPDDVDGTLTAHERAFVRSLYRQNKLRRPRGTIRKPQWHEVTRKGRRVTVTMFSASSGADHVEQHPESSWVEHPELRSHRGFTGSGRVTCSARRSAALAGWADTRRGTHSGPPSCVGASPI